MPNRRLLKDTVTLNNAQPDGTFAVTVLDHIGFVLGKGVNMPDRADNTNVSVYIFDMHVKAETPSGQPKTFMSYDSWVNLPDNTAREAYWTLNSDGNDFIEGYRIVGVKRFATGTPRNYHWKVVCK